MYCSLEYLSNFSSTLSFRLNSLLLNGRILSNQRFGMPEKEEVVG
jgi:hypothetical protein